MGTLHNISKQNVFGNNMRYYRLQKGLTLKEVSEALGVSINYLSNLEQGKGKIKPDFLPELCKVLGVKLSSLFEDMTSISS
jgi:transcriptional regulator with XRE-family HTH domain